MTTIKTIAAFGLCGLTAIVLTPLGIIAFILSIIGFRKLSNIITYKIAQRWARITIAITGCTVEVKGRENIPKKGALCFVSNHVGLFDIILTLAYLGRPFGFIAKKELIYVPFINIWISILGGLYIDRKNIRKAIGTINKGIKVLQNGSCMLIFPEGTRNKGEALLPFKAGSIKLATNSLATILPIAITGSYDVFERHNKVHSVPLKIVFCPPIITADMAADVRRHKLADMTKACIEAALQSNYTAIPASGGEPQ